MNLKLILISAICTALLVSCPSTLPNETVFQTQSHEPTASSIQNGTPQHLSSVSDADAGLLRTDGITISHTFSNGEMLQITNETDMATINGDEVIALTKYLPDYIDVLEQQYAKHKNAVSTKSFGLNPNGCSLVILFCITPTSTFLWSTHNIPYNFGSSLTAAQKTLVTASISRWNATPGLNVKWLPAGSFSSSDRPRTFEGVNAGTQYCGRAALGYQGRAVSAPFNPDYLNINTNSLAGNCFIDQIIHHEMGHSIGLLHEQARCDRGLFITLVNGVTEAAQCGNEYTTFGKFDFSSLMLYDYRTLQPLRNSSGQYNGSANYVGNPKNFPGTALSPTDIITINTIYTGR
jgi:Astacin (Peptidase family M12A)